MSQIFVSLKELFAMDNHNQYHQCEIQWESTFVFRFDNSYHLPRTQMALILAIWIKVIWYYFDYDHYHLIKPHFHIYNISILKAVCCLQILLAVLQLSVSSLSLQCLIMFSHCGWAVYPFVLLPIKMLPFQWGWVDANYYNRHCRNGITINTVKSNIIVHGWCIANLFLFINLN